MSDYINKHNWRKEYPMHKACRSIVVFDIFNYARTYFRSGDKKTAEILVKHGGNVNVLNDFYESPLYFAADYSDDDDNVKLVQFLVEK